MFLTIVFLNFSSQRAKIHHSTNLAKKIDSDTDCVIEFEVNHHTFLHSSASLSSA